MGDIETLSAELERLYQRQADLRAHEVDLAERGENDPASDEWKLAAVAASVAESDFRSALVRNYSTISRVLREAADGGWRPIETAPKDGTLLILTNGGWVKEGWWSTSIWLGRKGPGWVIDDERECGFTQDDVTHWRPLPPPPATETTKTEEPRNDD